MKETVDCCENKELCEELHEEHHHEESCECHHGHEHHHEHEHHHDHHHDHEHHHDHGHEHGHDHEHGEEAEDLGEEKKKFAISLVLFIFLLILEHLVKPKFMENRLVAMLCYMIPWFIAGWDAIKEAVESLVHGEFLGEEFLMVVASAGAFAIGENAEACAVLLFYSLGELLEDMAVSRSRKSIRDMMDIAPESANLLEEDGSFTAVDPDILVPGNKILVLAGERIPVDGSVLSGNSLIDTSSLTGESVPKSVHEGDAVISGCLNGSGTLTVLVEKAYDDSTVAKVMELTEEASDRKSPTETFISKFARVYTPIVVGLAVILAIIPPLLFHAPFTAWLKRACTFLVISCPCALVISVPLSFFGGIGAASKIGVLVKGSNFLEALTHVTTMASDKTGTLTKGTFTVTGVELPDGSFLTENALSDSRAQKLLKIAAGAEQFSDHPIAKSILLAAEGAGFVPETAAKPEVTQRAGLGLSAVTEDGILLLGSERLLTEEGIEFVPCKETGTICYMALGGTFLGAILISDTVKPEAQTAVKELRTEGVTRIAMLTGDAKTPADAVKDACGLDEVYAELLPQNKVEILEKLEEELSEGAKLLYAGDGFNDAPVLARADIGTAMGSLGSDAAIEAADVVIMDDDIRKIPAVIRIAKKTVKIARENIIFALFVKVLFLVLGAFGMTGMWMAVFADVGVALLCVLNSMRSLK